MELNRKGMQAACKCLGQHLCSERKHSQVLALLNTPLYPAQFQFCIPFFITIRVSNRLDPDQARHIVGPDLDPNCLQRPSADDASMQRVGKKYLHKMSI